MQAIRLFVLCLLLFSAPHSYSADLAFWDELQILSKEMGAISYLDQICSDEEEEPIAWKQFFDNIHVDPILSQVQKKIVLALYEEAYFSYQASYRQCTPNALDILLEKSRIISNLLQEMEIEYIN